MMMLAINWGFALLVTGIGIGTVFCLLVVLIWIINLQSKMINSFNRSEKTSSPEAVPATTGITDTHPTPYEQAAIAMAMHLYFDAHDEEPHVITIEEVERRYSPWSSKIYSMRNTTMKY